MILVFILYALFASVFTISKTGLAYTQPLFFVGSRMLIAGALLILYQAVRDPKSLNIKKSDWIPIIMLALFSIHLTNAFEFWGLQYLPSFKACFFYSLSPFISALIAYFFLAEKMTAKKWMGLGIGFVGMLPMILSQTEEEKAVGQFLAFSWAELAVLCAAVTSVFGWILLKKVVDVRGYSPIVANGYSMLIGGTTALLHSYIQEDWNPYPFTEFMPFLTSALMLIVISNFICYNLYGHLLRKYSSTFMSFAGFLCPLCAAFFGWFFLNEQITLAFYLSAAFVFSGLALFNSEEAVAVNVEQVVDNR